MCKIIFLSFFICELRGHVHKYALSFALCNWVVMLASTRHLHVKKIKHLLPLHGHDNNKYKRKKQFILFYFFHAWPLHAYGNQPKRKKKTISKSEEHKLHSCNSKRISTKWKGSKSKLFCILFSVFSRLGQLASTGKSSFSLEDYLVWIPWRPSRFEDCCGLQQPVLLATQSWR